MGTFAMMAGNVVENLIAADDKEETERALGCVLIEVALGTSVGIGWTYNETDNVFVAPPTEQELDESA